MSAYLSFARSSLFGATCSQKRKISVVGLGSVRIGVWLGKHFAEEWTSARRLLGSRMSRLLTRRYAALAGVTLHVHELLLESRRIAAMQVATQSLRSKRNVQFITSNVRGHKSRRMNVLRD